MARRKVNMGGVPLVALAAALVGLAVGIRYSSERDDASLPVPEHVRSTGHTPPTAGLRRAIGAEDEGGSPPAEDETPPGEAGPEDVREAPVLAQDRLAPRSPAGNGAPASAILGEGVPREGRSEDEPAGEAASSKGEDLPSPPIWKRLEPTGLELPEHAGFGASLTYLGMVGGAHRIAVGAPGQDEHGAVHLLEVESTGDCRRVATLSPGELDLRLCIESFGRDVETGLSSSGRPYLVVLAWDACGGSAGNSIHIFQLDEAKLPTQHVRLRDASVRFDILDISCRWTSHANLAMLPPGEGGGLRILASLVAVAGDCHGPTGRIALVEAREDGIARTSFHRPFGELAMRLEHGLTGLAGAGGARRFAVTWRRTHEESVVLETWGTRIHTFDTDEIGIYGLDGAGPTLLRELPPLPGWGFFGESLGTVGDVDRDGREELAVVRWRNLGDAPEGFLVFDATADELADYELVEPGRGGWPDELRSEQGRAAVSSFCPFPDEDLGGSFLVGDAVDDTVWLVTGWAEGGGR